MSLYDVIEQRLAQDEKSIMVTVLSGERQGDKVLYNEKGEYTATRLTVFALIRNSDLKY